jgi:UDP-N-acetylglucosamine 2-epimerase (non-hydrolysing)
MKTNKNKATVAIVVGARPNFMKAAPLCRALERAGIAYRLIHTGQHHDTAMSQQYFDEFKLYPHRILGLESSTQTGQLSEILRKLEDEFKKTRPIFVIVVGDVTSTLAGALTANKHGIPLAHVEAGLRSYNRLMPEETNRVLVDHMADFLFSTSKEDKARLAKEGIISGVHVVGNTMIDTLAMVAEEVPNTDEVFYFATLHRAENVDNKEVFTNILAALESVAHDATIYLPLHPRTEKMARTYGLLGRLKKTVTLLLPVSYKESVYYQKNAQLVLTDSGGIQEEASFLGTPCLTLRTETERPITVTHGTNVIGGIETKGILKAYRLLHPLKKQKTKIPLWDGNAAERIVQILQKEGIV